MPKVTVVIPVYKVERYIEMCARSLFSQTLDDIEYIFVDDCSPDRSVEILGHVLSEFPRRTGQVRILRTERNSGQAAVRELGIKAATGDYVIHCDSDDWVCDTMYETLYQVADESEADIVTCDFTMSKDGKTLSCHGWLDEGCDPVAGVLDGSIPGYCWNKLVRRSLFDKPLLMPSANLWEDRAMAVQLYHYSRKSVFVRQALYFYRIHPGGICLSEETGKRVGQVLANTSLILSFLDREGLSGKYSRELTVLKSEVQMNALSLPREEYMKVFPENRWRRFLIKGIPFDWNAGHLAMLLGIHGVSRLFKPRHVSQ